VSGTNISDQTGKPNDRRKLIAVAHMDMVGYSRLIGLDDQGTLERLRALRSNVIDPTIGEHGGRIVQTGGDSLLIVFDSIDGAVRCAVKVQQQVPSRDRDQPPDRAIRFRIGINLGDAIADGSDLHGDAVNVAARLQAECPPGGICVSRSVRDHVHGRLDLAFEELGALNLKNIARPVEAFVLRLDREVAGLSRPSSNRHSHSIPTRPRLSVLVGAIQSQGFPSEDEYLIRGITEDVTADLSGLPGSFVVGRADGMVQRGKPVDLMEAARELGVCYVIQGSMRKVGTRVAVNVQLVSAETGAHIWAERFHVDPREIADAHDEITGRLVRTFSVKLIEDVNSRIEAIDPQDWTPDDLVMHGRGLLSRPHFAANRHEALKYFEQAFERDPGSAGAKYGIANVLMSNVLDGWSLAPEQDKARAEQLLTEILRDDADNADAHVHMGTLRRAQGRLSDARIELEIAVGLAPNNIHAIGHLGITLTFLGHPEAAVPLIERCLRLAPHDRNTPVNQAILGLCKFLLDDVDEAVIWLRKARAANPRLFYIHAFLAAALALRDELDEAGDALRQAVKLRPEFGSKSDLDAVLRESSPQYLALWRKTVYAGLIRAGLPQVVPNFAPLPDEFSNDTIA
jgi:adenylate cyclase